MTNASLPPQAVLAQLINGYWITGTLHAAAALGVADAVGSPGDAPRPVVELAGQLAVDEESLFRLLRALASLGIFVEGPARAFGHTPLSQALKKDVPGSVHGLALVTGLLHMRAWPEIAHSVRTGETAFKKSFGNEIFEYTTAHPEAGAAFDAAMAGYVAAGAKAVVGGYDFSPYRTIVDVGGGNGALLATILAHQPAAKGINFDLPASAERAKSLLAARNLVDRCEVMGGDFFKSVPGGGDAYTLKMILHDWDDERSIAILKNIRDAMAPNGRVLIIEAVVEEATAAGTLGKLLDVNMLVMTGGRERTLGEYDRLLAAAGFRRERVVPVHPTMSVIEASRA